jgi:hypothetical protein
MLSPEQMSKYVEVLMAKVVVLENLTRSLLIENFVDEDHPITAARDFFERVRVSMTGSVSGGSSNPAAILAEENLALSLSALEDWLRQEGARD